MPVANPILAGCHPDPSICRVGEDYFVVTSSFGYHPGLPIHHSRDLVHWHVVGRALERPGLVRLDDLASGQGLVAPSLRWHQGRFWLMATVRGGPGTLLLSAPQANGPWSDPVWIQGLEPGVEPVLHLDGQGRAWCVHAGIDKGAGILAAELDLGAGRLRAAAQPIWAGQAGMALSRPLLFEREGWHYLLCTEGQGWDQGLVIARSRAPAGPYEPCLDNPILSHRNAALEAWQMLGAGAPVQTADGGWWLLFNGARPVGRVAPLGRELLLAPLVWDADGWPVVHERRPITGEMRVDGLPASKPWPAEPAREDFKGPGLAPQWQFLRGLAPGLWNLSERPGWLRLTGSEVGLAELGTPAFVACRQTAPAQRATTLLDFAPLAEGQGAGLALRHDEGHHALLRITGTGPRRAELVARVKGRETRVAQLPLGGEAAYGALRLRVDAWPERYDFFVAAEVGDWQAVGSVPTSALAVASGCAGARFGLFASGPGAMPPANFDWFALEPL